MLIKKLLQERKILQACYNDFYNYGEKYPIATLGMMAWAMNDSEKHYGKLITKLLIATIRKPKEAE